MASPVPDTDVDVGLEDAQHISEVGMSLVASGDVLSAVMHYEAALDVLRTTLGPAHAEVASLSVATAALHEQCAKHFLSVNDPQQALMHYDRQLTLAAGVHGGMCPEVARIHCQRASVFEHVSNHEGAFYAYSWALDILAKIPSPTPAVKTELAELYYRMGQLFEAWPSPSHSEEEELANALCCYVRSLYKHAQVFGFQHEATLKVMNKVDTITSRLAAIK